MTPRSTPMRPHQRAPRPSRTPLAAPPPSGHAPTCWARQRCYGWTAARSTSYAATPWKCWSFSPCTATGRRWTTSNSRSTPTRRSPAPTSDWPPTWATSATASATSSARSPNRRCSQWSTPAAATTSTPTWSRWTGGPCRTPSPRPPPQKTTPPRGSRRSAAPCTPTTARWLTRWTTTGHPRRASTSAAKACSSTPTSPRSSPRPTPPPRTAHRPTQREGRPPCRSGYRSSPWPSPGCWSSRSATTSAWTRSSPSRSASRWPSAPSWFWRTGGCSRICSRRSRTWPPGWRGWYSSHPPPCWRWPRQATPSTTAAGRPLRRSGRADAAAQPYSPTTPGTGTSPPTPGICARRHSSSRGSAATNSCPPSAPTAPAGHERQSSAMGSHATRPAMPITSLPSPPFDLIRCDDPRLRSICPTLAAFGPSTVAQLALTGDPQAARTLNTAEAQLRSWAARTARTTLDDLAAELLDAWERSRPPDEVVRYGLPVKPGEPRAAPPLRPEVRQAVAARLGLRGAPAATLATAARGSGVSTERIRRVALQVQAAATTWAWAPALDEALRLGADPVDPDDYGDALQARGLTRRPWHPQAVNALARLCGRVQRVAWHPDPDRSLLLDLAEQAIRHRHLGIAPVVDIAATAAEQLGRPVKPEMGVAAPASGDRE